MRKMPELDRHYVKICCYAGVTVLVTLGCAMVLWYSSGFFAKLWALTCAVVEPLVVGFGLSYLLNPVVRNISHWLASVGFHPDQGKRRRRVAVIICMACVTLAVTALMTLLLALVAHGVSGVSPALVDELLDTVQGDLNSIMEGVADFFGSLGFEREGLWSLSGVVIEVKDFLQTALFSVIFCVYFLLDGDTVFLYVQRLVTALFGFRDSTRMALLFADIDRVFSGYIRGQAVDALIVGTLTAICFTLLRIPYGIAVGVLTGIGNLIPYVGGPMGYLSVAMVCLADGQPTKMVFGFIALTLIMLADANIINPRLLSESVEVHPLLVTAALIAGSAVGGLVGMLVAVPVAAFLKVRLDRWLEGRDTPETGLEETVEEDQ